MEGKFIKEKPCEKCGKIEPMGPQGHFCEACRKKNYLAYKRKYYQEHRDELIAKSKAWMKQQSKAHLGYAKHERRRLFPVTFNSINGRYSWTVRLKNEETGHTLLWTSDGDFGTMREAQKDFSKACSGGK